MMRIHFLLLLSSALLLAHSGHCQRSLAYYLEQAEANSTQIYRNQNLIAANELEGDRLRAEFTKPQVSLAADYLVSPYFNNGGAFITTTPADRAVGYDPAITNGGLYAALISVNQPLFNNVRFRTNYQQVLLQNQSYRYENQRTLNDLTKAITDQYILTYRDQEQIQNSRDVVQLLTEQLSIAERLVNAGVFKRSDYLLLSIEQKARQADLLNFQTAFFNDLIALDTLAAVTQSPDTVILAEPDLFLQAPTDSTSRFFRQYALDSQRIETTQQVTNLIYKPQVSLTADGGLNATTLTNLPRKVGFSAGVSFRWLLFDGYQRRINERKNLLLQETVRARQQRFINQQTVRFRRITRAIDLLNEKITLLQGELTDYRAVLEDYRNQVATGQLSVIDYVNTIKSFILLQNELTIARADQRTLINEYNYWNW